MMSPTPTAPADAVVPACPPLRVVVSWRKLADARIAEWTAEAEAAQPGSQALAESGVTLMRSLRRDLRQAEVRPPSALERRRRRQDGWAWVDELCQASVAPCEPIIAVRRVLRLWVGVAQQAAITGSAAAFAA